MSGLVLREAQLSDLQDLSALSRLSKAIWGYDEAFLKACHTELELTPAALEENWVLVAEDNGEHLGVAALEFDAGEAELERLFVHPHTLKRGIGARLFDAAVLAARRMGAKQMVIAADPNSVPFYERMGAYLDGMVPSQSINGRMLPRMIYGL